MEDAPLPPHALSAPRATQETVLRQSGALSEVPQLQRFADAMPVMVLVLNPSRQAVFANKALTARLGLEGSSWLGRRPGEILGCAHALESADGCGATAFCGTCGAVKAFVESQTGHLAVQECRVMTRDPGKAYDLRVWASPFACGGEKLTVFALMDVSDEKRKDALERIFFHDVLNTATAIKGLTEVWAEIPPERAPEFQRMALASTGRLIEEILAQRDLVAAESGELVPHVSVASSVRMLQDLARIYSGQRIAKDRTVAVEDDCEDVSLRTDCTLLMRVLGNLLKNALEASPAGAVVRLACRRDGDHVVFRVSNPGLMPMEVQLQMFQRSFSTKGNGRGLGTYSVKLLSERYLKGSVSFESSPEKGTTFLARYPLELPKDR